MKQNNLKINLIRASILIVLIVFLVIVRCYEEVGFDKSPQDRFIITKVIDGDTVELKGGDKLRLLGIDTPEKNQLYYDSAKALLSRNVLGKESEIKFAVRRRDKYGRLLGFLYVDSIFINQMMIDSGMAHLYLFKDNDLQSEEFQKMLDAQRNVLNKDMGIWSVKYHKEDYYINLSGSLRFHRPGCNSIRNANENKIRRFNSRENAMYLGLSPCRNCKP
ncbi:MAG: thermonuclease family protein [candidate division Zixibacteria bacterium]|nr:thermonuclease family protein [candidate division Zixibacteria bacterium]